MKLCSVLPATSEQWLDSSMAKPENRSRPKFESRQMISMREKGSGGGEAKFSDELCFWINHDNLVWE